MASKTTFHSILKSNAEKEGNYQWIYILALTCSLFFKEIVFQTNLLADKRNKCPH